MPDDGAPTDQPATAGRSWRVNSRLTVLKFAGAGAFLVAAVAFLGDPVGLAVSVLAAVGLVLFAVRDVLAPVRLAADPAGITVVTGFNGRRRVPWSAVEVVRVDERRRLGVRS